MNTLRIKSRDFNLDVSKSEMQLYIHTIANESEKKLNVFTDHVKSEIEKSGSAQVFFTNGTTTLVREVKSITIEDIKIIL